MIRYPRVPALMVLVITALLGLVYVLAWGEVDRFLKHQNGGAASLESLEKKIAEDSKKGTVAANVWFAYGEMLAQAGRHGDAANAFRQAMTVDPSMRQARFQCGLMLAMANRAEEFYNYQKELVYSEAKLAVELFERPEAQKFLGDEKFMALAKEAKSQSVD